MDGHNPDPSTSSIAFSANGAREPAVSVELVRDWGQRRFTVQWRVQVSNACGNATSAPGVLSICVADTDDGMGTGACDGGVTCEDLLYFLRSFDEGMITSDVDDGTGSGTPDGGLTIDDLLYYLVRFDSGC